MGLDMYLRKRIYIGADYEHNEVKGEINLTKRDRKIDIKLSRVSSIEETVGYWRKANQIHNWFVKNVQKGVDDCGDYYVDESVLKQLLADCKAVKDNKLVAADVLPTKSGFFFGGTEYDEYYINGIDETIQILESVLSETDERGYLNGDIYYTSSW
jgi:hypothetical protein